MDVAQPQPQFSAALRRPTFLPNRPSFAEQSRVSNWSLAQIGVLVTILLTSTRGLAQDTVETPPDRSANSEATASERSLTDLAASLQKSLVVVKATGRDGRDYGHGTGFVISDDGLIVTARHVIGDRRPVRVELSDGTSLPVTHIHAATEAFDLVVLRVSRDELTAVPLGDSEALKIGQSIVVAGHPQGLKDSVFQGILSGHHDIDDISMLQLSVTVEPGSSGEPVVDRQGRVIGIVTMKSTQQSNLGFALPVRHLKTLLENPSPIPIERWMTIGALDASQWSILYGANWRQRASRILVDGYGDSFGGRSLCLKPAPEPDKPFEIQVDVRLDDESGAAGLAFHSDGAHRHYGFYPSAGKLRLTRFNGPDLNSWTILHNEAHPAWRAGEWNTIKVRLEDERFLCYLNDQLVVESKDALIPSGQCGLATFRGTSASFRRFQVADSIPSRHPSPEEAIAIADILSQLQTNRPPTEAAIEQLLPFRDRTSLVLAAEARRLEQRSQRLRQLAKDVHAAAVRKQLLSALGRESADKIAEPAEKPVAAVNAPEADAVETSAKEPDLLKAALLIARLDNEEVDPDVYVERVDRLAAEVRQTLPADASEADRLKALDQMLFREYGFRGSQFEYYTTSNSYLNEVIDDREGLPITLSVLYIELAKRLDLNVVGLGLPGHYVVRFEPTDDGRMQIIDVYNRGERISQQEAESLITARGFPQRPEFFEGQPPVKIVERMLLNLLGLAEGRRDDEGVLRYLETLALLDDQNLEYRAKRLEMRARTERLEEAIADADWFIERDPGNADRLYELRAELQRSLDARTTETGLQGLRPTP